MVTHNVEEAVMMSDRVVVLSDKPTRLKEIKHIGIKQPRNRKGGEFGRAVDDIYAELAAKA
jgi:NitT/TauT family transport system ATP-binding protein